MADVDITSLSVEISAESQGAELNIDKLTTAISNLRTKGNVSKVIDGLDKLTNSLTALKSAQGDFNGLEKVTSFIEGITKVNASDSAKSINILSRSIQKIPDALSGIGDYSDALDSLRDVTDSFNSLSTIQAPKGLSSTINALKKIPDTMSGMDSVNSDLTQTKAVLASFNTLPTVTVPDGLTKMVNTLRRIPTVIAETNKADYKGLGDNIREIMNALAPLSLLDISGLKGLSSAFTALNKVPDLSEKLKAADLDSFADFCHKISAALTPLASQLDKVGNAFAKLPPQLSKVVTQANRVTAANERQKKSYMSLSSQLNGFMRSAAKLVSLKAIATYLGNAAEKFNSYYEAANLFGVSMKGLTGEASTFINKMETLLGIDPTEAMNNMATIQGLTTSFGMASDKAYVLSKNLTQLGYDLASLKNIPVAESFTKIQAAISGELEPIRRLGVDISNARLQQELLNLGYSQSVSTLSQADKAVLRYIAIMKQTTDAQGDFARTLSSPANMIRILQAQLNSLARAVGSLLYPALKSILPPLIAAVELVKELVTGIASLMGVKVEFPDFSSASDAVGGVTDAMDNTTKATGKAAKAFKNYIMGFDELNVIQKDNGSSGGSGSGAGAAGNILGDIDLSGYDMFEQYNEEFAKQIDSIKEKIRGMLPIIGAVTAALALWKLTTFIADIVDAIKKIGILKGMVAGGILIGIGFFLMFDGIKKAIQDKLNAINFSEILVGAITFVGGAALLGSKIAEFITTSFADSAVAKAITAAGGKMGGALVGAVVAGVIAGVAMFVTGVYDALTNGLNILNGLLIPAGSTMAGAAVGAIIGSLGGPIGAGIGAIIGLIVGGLTDAGIAIYQNWDKITAALDKASADLKQWFVGVGEWWDKKWKGFKTNWDKAWNSLADTLKALPKKFWDYGKNVVQGLIDGINNGIENAKKTVGGLAKAILDKFTTDTGIHSPSKVFWGFGGYIVEGLAKGITAAKELAENAMQKLSDSVITLGQQLTQENYGMGDANIAMTANGDETSLEKTAMSLRNVLSNVGGGLTDWLKKIKSSFTDFSDGINAVSDVGKKISQGFTDSINALSNTSKSIVETKKAFKSVFSDMKTYVKSSIAEVENEYHYNGALSAAGLAIQKAFEGAYLALDKVSTAVKSLSGTIDSIKNVVKTFNDLKTKVGEVIDQVPVLKDAYNGLKTFFSNLFGTDSGIVKIVSNGWDLIKTKAGEALMFISGKIKALGVGGASGSSGGLASMLGAIGSTALPAGAGVLGAGAALGLGITGHVQWIKDLKNTWSDSSKSFGEKVFNTVNDTLTDIFNPFGAVIKIAKNKFGFADGGFPDDGQLFLARESGPEFVGSMGGHTAVANNDQIVEGIREGVESAMAKQNELLRQQNELLKALLEKESTSEISVSSISQAISRVNQRNGKTIIPIGT
nr:MAG TPA: minor tail protein [Caudoviricetes sp.]